MDPNSFENIKRAVSEQNFKDEKLDALRSSLSCAYGYLSADQVAELVPEFTFDDDKETALGICAPRLYSITCDQAASILRVFSFDKSKIKALEAIAGKINDNNLLALESAFDFNSDKERAREIMMNRQPQPGPHHGYPQPGAYPNAGPPGGGFPGMAPQPGGYPGGYPASYPGQPPCPGHNPYPGAGPYGGMQPPYGQPGAPGAAPMPYTTGTVPPPTGYPGYPAPGGYPPQGYPHYPGGAGQ